MPLTRQETRNRQPYIVISDNAWEEIDGYLDYLFDSFDFHSACKYNRSVSDAIDLLSSNYMRPHKIIGNNQFTYSVLSCGFLFYSIYKDIYGRYFVYVYNASFNGYRKNNTSVLTQTNRPLITSKQNVNTKYIPTKQIYYNGLRKGYNRKTRKYNILNKEGLPLSNCPLERIRFFKKPFGKLNIIAHVSVNGELWAMSIKGQFYDMNTTWHSRYLAKNEWRILIGQIISETINNYLRNHLLIT